MDGHIVGSMISANSITGEQIQANSIKTANLELSVQKKIQDATDEETVKALIKADLDGFESTLSKEFVTVENAATQIQQATEVAVKEATQSIIDNAVSESMGAVDGQLNDKLNQYTSGTLLPAIAEKAEEVLQNAEDYVVTQLESYATKQELSSSISQTREQIELSVSEKYTTKTESATIITEAIDGITVGAINRVLGTGENKSFKFNGGANETWLPYKFSNDISDKEVFVSFKYTLTGTAQNGSQIEFAPSYLKKTNNQTVYRPKHVFFTSDRLQDVNITDTVSFTTKDFQDISPSSTSYIRFVGNGFTGTLSVSEVQIKQGNSKTTWSPAPEDTISDINDAKNEAINSANGTLIATISNYYTKSETDSAISVVKDEINLGVSNTYETKTNVETKINSTKNELNTEIGKKANTADVYTKTEVYTKDETNSQINVAKDAVTTSVSNLRSEVMSATYTNLLENSDFLILDSGFPRGYSSYTVGDSEVRISDWKLQGAKAVKITSSGKTAYHWVALFSPFIKTIEGQPFTASAWVATSSVSGIDAGCLMEIEWFNDTDRIATASYPFTPQTDNTWERIVVTGWSPTGTTRARVRISVQQNGILYATKLMLQDGITATAWTRGGDFETITTRIATAEQKITDESITNTVKQNFYTKTETENAITSKDYATKSEVQQTANNITYKFTQSGGYNLIRNGNPKPNNYRHWWISSNGNWYLNRATDIGIQTTSTNEAYAGSANFKVESGKAYSFSCWLMAEVNTKGADVYFIGSANDDGAYTEVHHIYNGSGDGVWRQVKGTFTVGSNINYGFIRVDNNGRKDTSTTNNTVVFFSEVQMVKGAECYPQWSPNPNEVYDGITTIDKDGITVSQSNINTKTTMNASGFYINKNGQGDVFKVDTNGLAITGKITSNEVIMANGGMYTGQAVRGTNTNGFVVVGSSGDTTFRSDAGQVYLQTNDEVKVTAPSNPNAFKNLRANNIYANNDFYATRDATINRNLNVNGEIVAVGSLTSNSNIHLGNNGLVNIRWGYGVVRVNASGQPLYLQCNDEVKCTKPADPSTYTSLRAYNLMAQNKVYANGVALTSSRDKKKNVEVYEESALQQILQTKIYRYHLLDDLDEEMKRIGIILQEAPVDAIDIEGVGVDLYQMVTMTWKAIQELKQEIDKREALEKRMETLEEKLNQLISLQKQQTQE